MSASASFTIGQNASGQRQLTILLTNTDTATGTGSNSFPNSTSEVLTGLFFNLGTSSNTLTPVSATLEPNASIVQTNQCDSGANCGSTQKNVGGEFSYAKTTSLNVNGTTISGFTQGISSSAYLGANNTSGNFPGGTNLDSNGAGTALGGVNFGIVPDGWQATSGDSTLDTVPLIEGTVKFVLNLPSGLNNFTEADIKNVYFTYGSDTAKKSLLGAKVYTAVPEPAVLSMLGLALAGVGYRLRRRRS